MKRFVVLLASVLFLASPVTAIVPAIPLIGEAATILLPIMTPIALSAIHGAIINVHQISQGHCPSTCRGTAVICKTAAGLSMCKGLCQKIEQEGPYEVKTRFGNLSGKKHAEPPLIISPELQKLFKNKDQKSEELRELFFSLLQEQKDHTPPQWSLQSCVRQRVHNSSKNTPQGKGGYELELMEHLPKDKKGKALPAKKTIYLDKKSDSKSNSYLEYTVINRKGKSVTKTLNISVEGDLTKSTLEKYRFEILDALIQRGDIYTWKSIAVYNETQREQLITLIGFEIAAGEIIGQNAIKVKIEELDKFVSETSLNLKSESEKRQKVVEYAKKAIFEIQSAIEAKRTEYGLQ